MWKDFGSLSKEWSLILRWWNEEALESHWTAKGSRKRMPRENLDICQYSRKIYPALYPRISLELGVLF